MHEVSTVRLYVLRATYLLITVGLALTIWPLVINAPTDVEHMRGVARALLAGLSVVALLGVRYPLRMLPLLFFEFVWKAIWILAFGIPAWRAGALTPDTQGTLFDCMLGIVLVPLVLPWRYVIDTWVRQPAEPSGGHAPAPVIG